jgi:hypothetical protein
MQRGWYVAAAGGDATDNQRAPTRVSTRERKPTQAVRRSQAIGPTECACRASLALQQPRCKAART